MDIRKFIKEKQWKKWKKDQWLIVFLAGVLLLVIAIPVNSGKKSDNTSETQAEQTVKKQKNENQSDSDYEEQMEKKLEQVLNQMDGVGRVQVMITLKDTGESVVEKDINTTGNTTEESDSQGGTRKTAENQQEESTVYQDGTQEGSPFISKETMPGIEGVLVVAQGGGDTVTAKNISEAVEALFGIEAHKIKVVKMNMQEG